MSAAGFEPRCFRSQADSLTSRPSWWKMLDEDAGFQRTYLKEKDGEKKKKGEKKEEREKKKKGEKKEEREKKKKGEKKISASAVCLQQDYSVFSTTSVCSAQLQFVQQDFSVFSTISMCLARLQYDSNESSVRLQCVQYGFSRFSGWPRFDFSVPSARLQHTSIKTTVHLHQYYRFFHDYYHFFTTSIFGFLRLSFHLTCFLHRKGRQGVFVRSCRTDIRRAGVVGSSCCRWIRRRRGKERRRERERRGVRGERGERGGRGGRGGKGGRRGRGGRGGRKGRGRRGGREGRKKEILPIKITTPALPLPEVMPVLPSIPDRCLHQSSRRRQPRPPHTSGCTNRIQYFMQACDWLARVSPAGLPLVEAGTCCSMRMNSGEPL
ncbi:hypothetical protein FHG87_012522 [Trinorchestia longiramus]|nr:hypothetical protein FHG87_012522 [Trinorchestia longiramus]